MSRPPLMTPQSLLWAISKATQRKAASEKRYTEDLTVLNRLISDMTKRFPEQWQEWTAKEEEKDTLIQTLNKEWQAKQDAKLAAEEAEQVEDTLEQEELEGDVSAT